MAKYDVSDMKVGALENKRKNNVLQHGKEDFLPIGQGRTMFCGSTKSGKTNCILSLISERKFLYGYYHLIYLFSPTALIDDVFENVIPKIIKKQNVFPNCDLEVLQKIYDKQSDVVQNDGIDNAPRILLIFDDVLDNKKLLNNPIFQALFFRGRHINIGLFISVQSYNRLGRALRLQLSNVLLFRPKQSELKVIAEDICPGHLKKDEFMQLITHCTKEPYSFCHLNFNEYDQTKMVRKNFDTIVNINR